MQDSTGRSPKFWIRLAKCDHTDLERCQTYESCLWRPTGIRDLYIHIYIYIEGLGIRV